LVVAIKQTSAALSKTRRKFRYLGCAGKEEKADQGAAQNRPLAIKGGVGAPDRLEFPPAALNHRDCFILRHKPDCGMF